ncbi:rDNA transcriptional regulator pol5 [Pseudocercospora fuligena]|uniref:rDNA transcriptional regulator pol5 n=1 Tax=Pseudocercospora fuligena TaxID=685502 RepID=A0A8H6R8K0_9PEZI|nr:rDNA transcriptional regulator pol5 [Pseudocercospora fuligena]
MSNGKRPFEDDEAQDDNVHPSRKRRLENGDSKAEYAKLFSPHFNGLGDPILEKRLEATRGLLKALSSKTDDQRERLTYVNTRLIKGVCSGAKASRLGFSLALTEVLRLAGTSTTKLPVINVIDHINALTTPESKDDKKREYLLGRVYSYQAVLQSGLLSHASENDLEKAFGAIAELACEKDWLRNECGVILHEFLKGNEAKADQIKPLIESWCSKGIVKSPEGVALWLAAKKQFPDVKLPKGHWHHSNPLHAQERTTLTNVLLKNAVVVGEEATPSNNNNNAKGKKKKNASGTRQATPSFAWSVILAHLYEKDEGKDLKPFWEDCVAKTMFSASSSAERKSLGLQIYSKAISSAPAELLGDIVHANIIRCIVDQRAKPDRYLFEAAKVPLNQMTARAKDDPWAAAEMVTKMLEVIPPHLDKQTRLTIDNLVSSADEDNLIQVVKVLNELILAPGVSDPGEADKKRRLLADALLTTVRSRRSDPNQLFNKDDTPAQWLKLLLHSLTDLGFVDVGEKASPAIAESSQNVFRERLQSALGHLVSLPLMQAVRGPLVVVGRLHSFRKSLVIELDEKSKTAIKDARKCIKEEEEKTDKQNSQVVSLAFQLLLALGTLQVYLQQPDSILVLEDITACCQSPEDSEDSSTMLVELLIKFVSQQSALFRKLAEQVFTAFAPEVTAEGLESMIDILSQKESLAGQQELFGEEEQDASAGGDAEDDDEEMGSGDVQDIEDASDIELGSDVELVNGNEGDSEEESSGSGSETAPAGDDELTEFERKLTEALGTEGMASDDDGSDMDDDEMAAVDEKLTHIFKEQKLGSNKKQQNKDAKENVVNLKNRILDLLLVFVKSQYANPIALDLLHPLVTLTRTTGSQPTARKVLDVLELFFDTAKKNKETPEVDDKEDLFRVLSAIHEDARLGGSKLHARACSRSSLFLAKILVHMDEGESYKRIFTMYGDLSWEWRTDPKSKLSSDLFSEWNNWYMQK